MANYTVLDIPTSTPKTDNSAAASIIATIARPPVAVEDEKQFFALFSRDYAWHNEWNQREAQGYLQAALLAYQYHFDQQVTLYKEQLIKIATRDMADRTRWMVEQDEEYLNFTYYHPDHQPLATTSFTAPYQSDMAVYRYQWVYNRIEHFPRLIPPNALQILARLEQDNMTPQAYWVADKVEIAQQRSLDPILCTQYGRWFVGIAQWE